MRVFIIVLCLVISICFVFFGSQISQIEISFSPAPEEQAVFSSEEFLAEVKDLRAQQIEQADLLNDKDYHSVRSNKIIKLLEEGEFAPIEAFAVYAHKKDVSEGKDLSISDLYGITSGVFSSGTVLGKEKLFSDRLNEYEAVYPDSFYPLMLKGLFYYDLAWAHRGTSYYYGVGKPQRNFYQDYMKKAYDAYEGAIEKEPDCYAVRPFLLVVAAETGQRENARKILTYIREHHPHEFYYMDNLYTYSLPKWGGRGFQIVDFIRENRKKYPDKHIYNYLLQSAHKDMRYEVVRSFRSLAQRHDLEGAKKLEEELGIKKVYDYNQYLSQPRVWNELEEIASYYETNEIEDLIRYHAMNNHANLAYELKKYDIALKYWDIVLNDGYDDLRLSLMSDGMMPLRYRGEYYFDVKGDKEKGLADVKRWTELVPDSALAHYTYGMYLMRAGARNGEPIEEAKKVIALDPTHKEASNVLCQHYLITFKQDYLPKIEGADAKTYDDETLSYLKDGIAFCKKAADNNAQSVYYLDVFSHYNELRSYLP